MCKEKKRKKPYIFASTAVTRSRTAATTFYRAWDLCMPSEFLFMSSSSSLDLQRKQELSSLLWDSRGKQEEKENSNIFSSQFGASVL